MRTGMDLRSGPEGRERVGTHALPAASRIPRRVRVVRLGILAGRGIGAPTEFRLRIELEDGRIVRLERTLHPGEYLMDGIHDILQRGANWVKRALCMPAVSRELTLHLAGLGVFQARAR